MVAKTPYSLGRVSTCCNIASAITSLIVMVLSFFGFLKVHHGPPSRSSAPNSSRASLYPQSLNPPSVNFMMFPLCTSVTESLSLSIAYLIAALTILPVPSELIGLIPIPEVSGNLILSTPISFCKNCITFPTSGVPASHSIPAYTSSLFSLKMIMSTAPGSLTGLGVPSYHLTGLTQANKSSF